MHPSAITVRIVPSFENRTLVRVSPNEYMPEGGWAWMEINPGAHPEDLLMILDLMPSDEDTPQVDGARR